MTDKIQIRLLTLKENKVVSIYNYGSVTKKLDNDFKNDKNICQDLNNKNEQNPKKTTLIINTTMRDIKKKKNKTKYSKCKNIPKDEIIEYPLSKSEEEFLEKGRLKEYIPSIKKLKKKFDTIAINSKQNNSQNISTKTKKVKEGIINKKKESSKVKANNKNLKEFNIIPLVKVYKSNEQFNNKAITERNLQDNDNDKSKLIDRIIKTESAKDNDIDKYKLKFQKSFSAKIQLVPNKCSNFYIKNNNNSVNAFNVDKLNKAQKYNQHTESNLTSNSSNEKKNLEPKDNDKGKNLKQKELINHSNNKDIDSNKKLKDSNYMKTQDFKIPADYCTILNNGSYQHKLNYQKSYNLMNFKNTNNKKLYDGSYLYDNKLKHLNRIKEFNLLPNNNSKENIVNNVNSLWLLYNQSKKNYEKKIKNNLQNSVNIFNNFDFYYKNQFNQISNNNLYNFNIINKNYPLNNDKFKIRLNLAKSKNNLYTNYQFGLNNLNNTQYII